MTKAPAFQFYAAEYLADMNVQLLTLEQEGIYTRLLSFCWREGTIPNDDARLAVLCKGCKVAALAAVKELFQVSEDGKQLFHRRLEKERDKQTAYREKQVENGKRGGRRAEPKPNPSLSQNVAETQEHAKASPSSSFASSTSSAKKEQKPSRDKREGDPRHNPFKLACEAYAIYKNVEFVWDGSEAKQLSLLLAATPGLTLDTFQRCLNSRAKTEVPHGDRPREWLGTILKYQEGPLDKFGKPTGGSYGTQSKGNDVVEALKRSLQPNQDVVGQNGYPPTGQDGRDGIRGLLL